MQRSPLVFDEYGNDCITIPSSSSSSEEEAVEDTSLGFDEFGNPYINWHHDSSSGEEDSEEGEEHEEPMEEDGRTDGISHPVFEFRDDGPEITLEELRNEWMPCTFHCDEVATDAAERVNLVQQGRSEHSMQTDNDHDKDSSEASGGENDENRTDNNTGGLADDEYGFDSEEPTAPTSTSDSRAGPATTATSVSTGAFNTDLFTNANNAGATDLTGVTSLEVDYPCVSDCVEEHFQWVWWYIVVIAVGGFIVAVLMATCGVWCCNKCTEKEFRE